MSSVSITERYQFPVNTKREAGDPIVKPDRMFKFWKDPSAAGKPSVTYRVFNGNPVHPTLVDLTLSGDEASAVNKPGVPTFPKYQLTGTQAMQQFTIMGVAYPMQAIDPSTLSTREEADALAAVCGGTVFDPYAGSPMVKFYANGETRYPWKIEFGYGPGNPAGPDPDRTRSSFVGHIIQNQRAKGVGAPGHWSSAQLAQGLLEWVPEVVPDGSQDTLGTVPVPIALLPGETLASIMVGPGIFTVVVNSPGTPSAGGGATITLTQDLKAGTYGVSQ